jgi:hypothetical protein
MFLLWPDSPRVHRRRVRFKAVVHPHPEATVRGARSRRVALLPVVPPIRRGLLGAPVAKAAVILDLPKATVVVRAPEAAAEKVRVHTDAPAARIAPPSSVALRVPRALRRVFSRPGGPPFLSDGTPESDLVFLLSSATLGAAARAEEALQSHGLEADARRLVAEVGDLAFGRAPVQGFWGDSPSVDALRLRLARATPTDRGVARLGFLGFYWWAGARLGPEELGCLPAELLPDAAAAVASSQGYRRAFELLAARAASGEPGGEADRLSRLLALRCALSGLFFPALVRFLLPPAAQRAEGPAAPGAWEPAMLALHAYRLAGHDAGCTHVAAALVSTIVRDQVARIARRAVPELRPREWGGPPMTPAMEAEHRQVVALVGVLLTQLWWTYRRPWPDGWGAPDAVLIERRVSKALGESGGPACDVFLDDSLAVAACHALLGHTPSARATLASTRPAEVFVPARDRLSRALERGAFDHNRAPVVGTELGRDFQGLLERLRNTPDPAEFGSPDWRGDGLRGRLLSRLQQRGPRGLPLALRTVIGPAFGDLDRFWLAPSIPRIHAVTSLAAWLDRQAPVVPSDRDFILFLDERCQAMAE